MSHSATSAYSPEAPSRSSWKQQLSLLKRKEASQAVIDAATRDEEVVFSPVARSFAGSIDFDRIGSQHMEAVPEDQQPQSLHKLQPRHQGGRPTVVVAGPAFSSSSSSSYHHQRVQTPVQRYANDSFEDMLTATGTLVIPVNDSASDSASMTVAPGAPDGVRPQDIVDAGKAAKKYASSLASNARSKGTSGLKKGEYSDNINHGDHIQGLAHLPQMQHLDEHLFANSNPRDFATPKSPSNASDLLRTGTAGSSRTASKFDVSNYSTPPRTMGVRLTPESTENDSPSNLDKTKDAIHKQGTSPSGVATDQTLSDRVNVRLFPSGHSVSDRTKVDDDNVEDDGVRFGEEGDDDVGVLLGDEDDDDVVLEALGEDEQEPTPFRVGISPMSGNRAENQDRAPSRRAMGRQSHDEDDGEDDAGDHSFLGSVERALSAAESKVGYRNRASRRLEHSNEAVHTDDDYHHANNKQALPSFMRQGGKAKENINASSGHELPQIGTQDHGLQNKKKTLAHGSSPFRRMVAPIPHALDEETRETMSHFLGSLRKKNKDKDNARTPSCVGVSKTHTKRADSATPVPVLPQVNAQGLTAPASSQRTTAAADLAAADPQPAVISARVREVQMSGNDKWDMVHSPHRRGRAQRREAHHVMSAPPNASALLASSDRTMGKEVEEFDNLDDDEYDTPMWRSDIEQSVHVESIDEKKCALEVQANAKLVDVAPELSSSSSSSATTTSSDVKRDPKDAVSLERESEVPSFAHVDRQERSTATPAVTLSRPEDGTRKTASKHSPATLLTGAKSEMTAREPIAEVDTSAGGTPLDQFKLALNPTSGEVYFYNRRTRQSQWELPEPKFGVVVNMQDHPDPRAEQEYRILLATYQEEQKRKEQRETISSRKNPPIGMVEARSGSPAASQDGRSSTKDKFSLSQSARESGSIEYAEEDKEEEATSSMRVVDSGLNLAASASVQSGREPGTATRRLIFSSVSNSAQFGRNQTEAVDLPQEIRQAAVTLMAVSPAAGSAAHQANIMVSTLFCPYCGERTARDSLLQHLERTCRGVIAASNSDHQKLIRQSRQISQHTDDRHQKTAHSGSNSVSGTAPGNQRESVDDYGVNYPDHVGSRADSRGSSDRSLRHQDQKARPVTSIGYRTPEKAQRERRHRREQIEVLDPSTQPEQLGNEYIKSENKENMNQKRLQQGHRHSLSTPSLGMNVSALSGGGEYPGMALPDSPVELHPCRHCSRTFALGRLEIHERVCQRIFGEKRHKYDALNKRTHDTPFRPTTVHACAQCGRNFAHKEEMLVHERACAMGHLGSASASRKQRRRDATPGSARRSSRRTPNRTGSGNVAGVDSSGLVWGSVSSIGSAGGGFSERYGGGSAIKASGGRRRSRNGSFQQHSGSFGSVIKGNGDTSFVLDTLDEREESFLNSPYENNSQSKLFDADAAVEFREDDDADVEGLVVQGPPSVVRVGSAPRSGQGNELYVPDDSSAASGPGKSNLRTPNTQTNRAGVQSSTGRSNDRSGSRREHDSISRSHAKSNCPFCKREVQSQRLSAHLLRCRRQQASRDKVWRDAKIRHTEGAHAVAHAHARRERHVLASTPSSATRRK